MSIEQWDDEVCEWCGRDQDLTISISPHHQSWCNNCKEHVNTMDRELWQILEEDS